MKIICVDFFAPMSPTTMPNVCTLSLEILRTAVPLKLDRHPQQESWDSRASVVFTIAMSGKRRRRHQNRRTLRPSVAADEF